MLEVLPHATAASIVRHDCVGAENIGTIWLQDNVARAQQLRPGCSGAVAAMSQEEEKAPCDGVVVTVPINILRARAREVRKMTYSTCGLSHGRQ